MRSVPSELGPTARFRELHGLAKSSALMQDRAFSKLFETMTERTPANLPFGCNVIGEDVASQRCYALHSTYGEACSLGADACDAALLTNESCASDDVGNATQA